MDEAKQSTVARFTIANSFILFFIFIKVLDISQLEAFMNNRLFNGVMFFHFFFLQSVDMLLLCMEDF